MSNVCRLGSGRVESRRESDSDKGADFATESGERSEEGRDAGRREKVHPTLFTRACAANF